MRRVIIFVAIVALISVGVFWFFLQRDKSASNPEDTARCVKPPSNTITTVSTGLRNQVTYDDTTAVLVEIKRSSRDSSGWPQALYAVKITPPGGQPTTAIWGVGNPRGLVLPIVALNQAAIENSTWGTGARDVAADANRQFASGLLEQTLIDGCVNDKANQGATVN